MNASNRSARIFSVERLEERLALSAGNILVSSSGFDNAEEVYEYNQSGTLLASIKVPDAPSGYDQIHQLVTDANGNIDVFYAGNYLATYDGSSWTFHTALNWKLFGVTYAGSLATYKNYVYAQSQDTGSDNGIIRFDTSNKYKGQLFTIPDTNGTGELQPQDVTMGMDGLLYTVCYNSFPGNTIVALDPVTMQVAKRVNLTGSTNGGHCVADAQGNLYVFDGGHLNKLAPNGTLIKSIVMSGTHIQISNDGELLVSQGSKIAILDESLNALTFFSAHGAYWGDVFPAWSTYQAPPGPADITGTVFNDRDASGTLRRKEKGLPGVTVNAILNGSIVSSTVTGRRGTFDLPALSANAYTIREILPAGYRQTTPTRRSYISVSLNGANAAGLLFGDTKLASISGSVFNDAAGTGTIVPSDLPLAGWTAFIDTNNNGVLNKGEVSVLTNSAGLFTFNLAAGTYTVRIVKPRGWHGTTPATLDYNLTVTDGEIVTGENFAYHF
jgi:hypothetical protein